MAKKHDRSDTINRVPDEQLPSHRERQRWDLSKRFSEIMDDLLPKLAVVTQKVNTYTGTDYSGVAALRREIKEQGTSQISTHMVACKLTAYRGPRQSPPPCYRLREAIP